MSLVKRSLVLLFALALFGGVGLLSAQQGLGGGLGLYGVGPRLGENVQLALLHSGELGLSEEQISSLQELQVGIEADVVPLENQLNAVRDQILAGQVDWSSGILQLQEVRAQYEVAAAPYRTGVANVLTTDQHWALQEIMYATWPGTGTPPGVGLGLRRGWVPAAGVAPGRALGLGRGVGLGRGAGLGLGARAGVYGRGLGRGYGRGYGRGLGRGLGRGYRWWR